jgi:chromosome segregation ATPase
MERSNDYSDVPPIAFLEVLRSYVIKYQAPQALINKFDETIHALAEAYEAENFQIALMNEQIVRQSRRIAELEQDCKRLCKHNEDMEDQIIELVGDIDKLEKVNEQARDAARVAALAAGVSPGDA